MPYAANNIISRELIEDSIEITEAQYAEALEAMLSGKIINIDAGLAFLEPAPQVYVMPPVPDNDIGSNSVVSKDE